MLRRTHYRVTDAMRRTLGLIAQHGATVRDMVNVPQGSVYVWRVGGLPMSRSVESLYSAGLLEPDNGDPHRMKISAKGREVLRSLLAVAGKAAA